MVKLPPKKIFNEASYYLQQLPSFSKRIKELVRRAGGLKRVIAFFLIVILILSGVVYSTCFKKVSLKVSSSVSPSSILIGDTVKFTFKVVMDKDTELEFPDIMKDLKGFEVRNQESFEEAFFRKRTIRRVYSITKYTPGKYDIPPMTLRYRDKVGIYWKTADTKEVIIRIKRLAKVEDVQPGRRISIGDSMAGEKGYKAASPTGIAPSAAGPGMGGGGPSIAAPIRYYINDLKGPKRVLTWQDVVLRAVLYSVGGILVLFVGILVINTIRHKPEKEIPPPHAVAIKALEELHSEKLLDKGDPKEFCAKLSRCLMWYTRVRYKMSPVEQTSAEFVKEAGEVKELTATQKTFLKEGITACDLVKYSAYEEDKKQLEALLKDGIKFIKETKLREEPEEENK